MNDVPLLFAETVARLFDHKSICSLNDLSSGHFGNAGRSLWENRVVIFLNVVYNSNAKTFDYCLSCRRRNRNNGYGPEEPYDPADHRFVRYFRVQLFSDINSLYIPEVTWLSATPSDPTLLKLLRAPFARTFLFLDMNCPEFLKLLPDYCTFNGIYAPSVYSEVLDAIIRRSQECGQLEEVNCDEFFSKRGREASIDWILTNKRLHRISYSSIKDHEDLDSVGSTLADIGVQ